MLDLEVIDDPVAAATALDPIRAQILAVLATPGSASTIGVVLDLPRQKVNYHLRILETHGLVRHVEDRPRRGLIERMMIASARSYLVSPSVLGDSACNPANTDRLSTNYLVAVAARIVQEVSDLARRAEKVRKPLATLALATDIRFASAADRAAFATELTSALTKLAGHYHDETSPGGRWHRVVIAAHPKPATEERP